MTKYECPCGYVYDPAEHDGVHAHAARGELGGGRALKTDFLFQLKETGFLGDLLKELHPTPAVCGLPKDKAYQFITEHEGYDRRYYSGYVGWIDPEGHTDIYVNLRCMEIRSTETKLYAGGGILPSSEVRSEWKETGEKMKTMMSLIPVKSN